MYHIDRMIRTELEEEEREEKRQFSSLKMVQENIEIATIARITEMSIAEIQQLGSPQ